MELPHKLPTASFRAGEISSAQMKYPHLTKTRMSHDPAVSYPGLPKTGCRTPSTKLPMGMTLPILTRMGAHPQDTSSRLPPTGKD